MKILNVDAMLSSMTWEQFQGWLEYYNLEPFGEERADLRAGIIASTIANANRGKNTKPFKPTDFMLKFDADSGTGRSRSGYSSGKRQPLTDPDEWKRQKAQFVSRLNELSVKGKKVSELPVPKPRPRQQSRIKGPKLQSRQSPKDLD